MLAPYRRFFLALLGGAFALPLLTGLAQRLPVSNRTLETVALFLLFVVICLVLDRFRFVDRRFSGPVPSEAAEARRLGQLRIGVPEGLVHLEALRQQQRLERRLAPLGVSVEWRDYISASALLQAINANEIDFGGGGGTPSVFAQAADLLFVRVARDKYLADRHNPEKHCYRMSLR